MTATITRPPRVVTKENSTVVDRASAWGMVERAQRAVNAEANATPALAAEVARFAGAVDAYTHLAPVVEIAVIIERAARWDDVTRAQLALNRVARRLLLPAVDALDAALDYYVEIGGNPKRAPGHGAPS